MLLAPVGADTQSGGGAEKVEESGPLRKASEDDEDIHVFLISHLQI